MRLKGQRIDPPGIISVESFGAGLTSFLETTPCAKNSNGDAFKESIFMFKLECAPSATAFVVTWGKGFKAIMMVCVYYQKRSFKGDNQSR